MACEGELGCAGGAYHDVGAVQVGHGGGWWSSHFEAIDSLLVYVFGLCGEKGSLWSKEEKKGRSSTLDAGYLPTCIRLRNLPIPPVRRP